MPELVVANLLFHVVAGTVLMLMGAGSALQDLRQHG